MEKDQVKQLRPGDLVDFPALGVRMRGTFVRVTSGGRGIMISAGGRYITALTSQVERVVEFPEDDPDPG